MTTLSLLVGVKVISFAATVSFLSCCVIASLTSRLETTSKTPLIVESVLVSLIVPVEEF